MNKHQLPAFLLLCASAFAASGASAAITGASATPRQTNVVAGAGNTVSISWHVTTSPEHRSGVTSVTSSIVDPATGTVLQGSRFPLSGVGNGPFVLREVVTLDPAAVRSWTDQGLRCVVLERTFADPATGSVATATAVLVLSPNRLQSARTASAADLSIVSLQVELGSGNNVEVVDEGEALRALLIVQHTGAGMLTGRWQIAGPESSDGVPLFRTLALVNTNLQPTQRSTLRSPALPTTRAGKYLLRFCAAGRPDGDVTGDALCPNADLVATATYVVQGRTETPVAVIGGLAPNAQAASGRSPFRWQAVDGAAAYQLQIFELASPAADRAVVRSDSVGAEPRFVAGMLLERTTTAAPLTELTRSKLRAGQRYLWRVTAHDGEGRTIGSSADATFVYEP